MDRWTEMLESGGRTDLEKAFDKIKHRRLLSKLSSYHVNVDLIQWIEVFFLGRKQRVVINGECSSCAEVLSGIPKGSFLGPLLFIILSVIFIEKMSGLLFADGANKI